MKFLAAWVLNAIALLLVANFVPDINMLSDVYFAGDLVNAWLVYFCH